MSTFTIWHWLIILVIIFGILFPVARILKRTGHNPFYSLLLLIPLVSWIMLWVFAYKKWPIDNK